MIFNTLSQLNLVVIFLFFGLICGFISIFYFAITSKNYNKNLINLIFNCIFYAFLSVFYVFLLIFFNFGKFSLILFAAFSLGFIWTKKLLNKLLVILEKKCYTTYKKLIRNSTHISNQRKQKNNDDICYSFYILHT